MFENFPKTYTELVDQPWAAYEPHYAALDAVNLTTATISEWLAAWTRLNDMVGEINARLNLAMARNTTDTDAEARFNRYITEIMPNARRYANVLKQKLLASHIEPGGFAIPLRNMRAEAEIFSEANLPLMVEEEKLRTAYEKTTGTQTFLWEGVETTIPGLMKLLQNPDRSQREGAWRAAHDRQLADRDMLNALWTQMMPMRQQMARNAGFSNTLDYYWKMRLRFDYTPQDSRLFHDSIEQVVVPAVKVLRERQRRRLNIDTVRPWDLQVDPFTDEPLRPFTTEADFVASTQRIFDQLDPTLAHYFTLMRQDNMLDLMSRNAKRPGGFCMSLAASQRPFIFMNAVGVNDNVRTLIHEAGHAFHAFEKFALPYAQQRAVTAEFNEVASMAMELLTFPYWEKERGGYYETGAAARAKIDHLEKIINFFPYMAVVDGFQHWAYTHETAATDPAQCDAAWDALWTRFMGSEDWSGLDDARVTGWHRKLHIFTYPFYYVEYGMAQIGAIQIYANMLNNPQAALTAYKHALSLGGTRGLPDLYTAAGARFDFSTETVGAAVELLMKQIDELEAQV